MSELFTSGSVGGSGGNSPSLPGDLRGRILDFNQIIGSIPAPPELSATHQKWIRVWQLRLEHVDLSIQAINEGAMRT